MDHPKTLRVAVTLAVMTLGLAACDVQVGERFRGACEYAVARSTAAEKEAAVLNCMEDLDARYMGSDVERYKRNAASMWVEDNGLS